MSHFGAKTGFYCDTTRSDFLRERFRSERSSTLVANLGKPSAWQPASPVQPAPAPVSSSDAANSAASDTPKLTGGLGHAGLSNIATCALRPPQTTAHWGYRLYDKDELKAFNGTLRRYGRTRNKTTEYQEAVCQRWNIARQITNGL
mmetsp:Transcript_58547/g.96634  ORF Transcript_58547/g.96634 Transcript_58547/m.96634 type:complete len:146 (-) Transcript_58547:413-850(-)|eukprot:CAMPEP_0119340446 /NCGR_PEP_ID=MMETSP1333-20130426/100394_1 /TAXON_ID=418940 /ORGANISM="Scyphosphaera apsteinii, Strain RCC1455" /LENGTH=145 /DNA_ID=CAMNT_0007352201 /DNA_START=26 /DNA_END=463 /DNA_ORIENTATION=-